MVHSHRATNGSINDEAGVVGFDSSYMQQRGISVCCASTAYRPGTSVDHTFQIDLYSQAAEFAPKYSDTDPINAIQGHQICFAYAPQPARSCGSSSIEYVLARKSKDDVHVQYRWL